MWVALVYLHVHIATEVILTGSILVQQWHVIYKSMVEDMYNDNICISTTRWLRLVNMIFNVIFCWIEYYSIA